MQELFIKQYWNEEDILFYIHFQNGEAVRQIEVASNSKVFLTSENPHQGESFLYDQSFDELDLEQPDFITEEEFNKVWDDQS
ncbi:hypothetical protein [Sphingobacterium sp. JUb56]|uniref:hypothetical protein n=1 Tax=Sphingobacterium sp. JUb56 TaxID=2587145 RepID=UPI00161F06DD|nr:hypothetical protein [Sphingobacterium sp. JUb56]MBB2951620.1 hypothetical protein [Sphingobacterium sp. JUb56]